MLGLIELALKIFPALGNAITGSNETKIAERVSELLKTTLNTNDPSAIEKAVNADPKLKETLQIRLAEIALEAQRIDLASIQAKRDADLKEQKNRLDSEDNIRTTALEQLKATLDADQKQRDQILSQIKINNADTQSARDMNAKLLSVSAPYAWINPVLSIIIVGGFLLFVVIVYTSDKSLPSNNKELFLIALGALAAAFSTVIGFHFGSSAGSKQKDAITQTEAVINAQQAPAKIAAAAEAARATADAAEVVKKAAEVVQGQADRAKLGQTTTDGQPAGGAENHASSKAPRASEPAADRPVTPPSTDLFAQELPNLIRVHRHMPDGVTWAITGRGVSVEGAPEARSAGKLVTIPKIWDNFGRECSEAARQFGVPVELIVATIATESRGDPNARRVEPDGRESVGLMQTLVDTARGELGASLQPGDLLQPAVSIRAGASYIARQRGNTHFDPPLVAAAYNAGSLRRADFATNRWRLICTPRETGAHIDRFIQWFGDAMIIAGEDNWGVNGTPSFAATLASRDPDDVKSPGFPRRPSFDALTSLRERQELFGKFDYKHSPVAGNPEHIDILGTWEKDNIVSVTLAGVRLPGKSKDLTIQFHRLGERQLRGLWDDWRKADLLSRIQSFDGGYNPRFQRGSTSALSNHAFGSAFDINASTNPLGAIPAQVGEPGCVRELVGIANKWGFFWGGHFRSRFDGMHFEIAKLMP